MKSNATNLPTKRLFATFLCIMAILIMAVTSGARFSLAQDSFAAASGQQISAGGPTNPQKSCPFGNHSRSFGTCSSAGLVGFALPAAYQVPPTELNASRFVMTPSAALTKICGSRLERPPRF